MNDEEDVRRPVISRIRFVVFVQFEAGGAELVEDWPTAKEGRQDDI